MGMLSYFTDVISVSNTTPYNLRQYINVR